MQSDQSETKKTGTFSDSDLINHIHVFEDEEAAGKAAAEQIYAAVIKTIEDKGRAIIQFASAPSQHSTWKAFLALWKALPDDKQICYAERIIAFNMDEYLGLPEDAPQLFGRVLQQKLFSSLGIPPENINLICSRAAYNHSLKLRKAIEQNDIQTIEQLTAIVEKEAEIEINRIVHCFESYGGRFDIVIGGIGKHPHVAFNDAPDAKFNDPKTVKVVKMLKESRVQQVLDGEFERIEDVPTHAITFTLPPIFAAVHKFIIVVRALKAAAVRQTLDCVTPTELIPASGLLLSAVLPGTYFFLDKAAAAESQIAQQAISVAGL